VQVPSTEKAPICGAFAEPSDGLEPSTPFVGGSKESRFPPCSSWIYAPLPFSSSFFLSRPEMP
jgi:hypothetical protein